MKRTALFALLALLLAACGKDKFETTPQVSIKSFGPSEVSKGAFFELVAEITDKEGDLQDSVLLVRKRFMGTTQVPPRSDDSSYVSIEKYGFPNTSTIELRILFCYGEQKDGARLYNLQEAVDRNVLFGIQVSDKAKNKSQFVESNTILLKKP